jgi:hypothetical protein
MAGHQRTADTPAGGGQADTGGGRYNKDRHTCLRYGGRRDTDGAPTWRQEKVYQQANITVFKVEVIFEPGPLSFEGQLQCRFTDSWQLLLLYRTTINIIVYVCKGTCYTFSWL